MSYMRARVPTPHPCRYGIARMPAPLPTAAATTVHTGLLLPGTAGVYVYPMALHFDDQGAMFVVNYYHYVSPTLGGGVIHKFVPSGTGSWSYGERSSWPTVTSWPTMLRPQ